MSRVVLALVGAVAFALVLVDGAARATPLYAVRAGHSCRTCHIEPSGWENPDFFQRDCTLSCKACHVSPAGGGMRTTSGRYYGMEVLPTWGMRPGDHGDPAKYRPAGHPDEGRYRLWEGFSGWWPGPVAMEDVPDRYGFLAPAPLLDGGADLRGMLYRPIGDEARRLQIFPMQADVYAALRPDPNWVFVGSVGLQGRRDGGVDGNALGKGVVRDDVLGYFTSRELYVMADDLPLGAYLRAGRFPALYGLRLADHTAFTRRNLGFDQDRSVWGVEAGLVQNYLYLHAQAFRQGFEGWFGEALPDADGASVSVGWRDLGYQLGFSAEALRRRMVDDDGDPWNNGGTFTTGMHVGVNLYPLVYLAELDWRVTQPVGAPLDEVAYAFAALHEVDWLFFRGLNGFVRYEWMDPNLTFRDDQFHRASVGLEWHPLSFTHLVLDYRYAWKAYDFVSSASHDALLMVHFWY